MPPPWSLEVMCPHLLCLLRLLDSFGVTSDWAIAYNDGSTFLNLSLYAEEASITEGVVITKRMRFVTANTPEINSTAFTSPPRILFTSVGHCYLLDHGCNA